MAEQRHSSELLEGLLITTRDGDWGSETPRHGLVAYRVIRGADFPVARVGDTASIPARFLSLETVARRTLMPNDIIIETAGGNRDRPTGRTLLVTERLLGSLDLPATCASFSRFLRIDPAKADPQYVFWYLQFLYQRGEMWEHQVQHTGVARFQYTKFAASTLIPLPPRSEQRAIAHILGTLDDKIELNRRMNETLEAMARAIFKSWFVDFDPVHAKAEGHQPFGMDAATTGLFPNSFQDSPLGRIPEGWCAGKVADLGEVICGKTPPTSDPDNYGQDVAFITIPDMHDRIFVTRTARRLSNKGAQFQAGKTIPTHSICVSCIATPGLVAVTSEPAQTNQQINSVVPPDNSTVFYCYWVLRNLADEIRAAGSGGSVTLNLNKGRFSALSIVLAPRVLIQSYQASVETLFARMLWNERESSTLTAIRDALLPKLISGELRVRDGEGILEERGI